MARRIRRDSGSLSVRGPEACALQGRGTTARTCVRANSRQSRGLTCAQAGTTRPSFTLIEMLVAMAITLIMMAAVVTLFANVSKSVSNRRATMELNAQIREVRNVLQEDLQGATCPGLTWQRPESNHGYIEIIEGPAREGEASTLIDARPNDPTPNNWPPTAANPEIDHVTSTIPSSDPKTTPFNVSTWATDGAGLGDYDDVLMLTVRNEHKPFVGRSPSIPIPPKDNSYLNWSYESVESPLAEVVWFAIENPGYTTQDSSDDPTANHFFGEPGMRTIYRRTLLIAPWLNPYKALDADGDGIVQEGNGPKFKVVPGLLRLLPGNTFKQTDVASAIAALISFQDRYDISCRLEWDHDVQQWKIMANTLGDLTKRENRFGHYGFWLAKTLPGIPTDQRRFPFAMESMGSGYPSSGVGLQYVPDPDIESAALPPPPTGGVNIVNGSAVSYSVPSTNWSTPGASQFHVRPFAYLDKPPKGGVPATANVMLNDDGQVVRVIHGPVPLWGTRKGEDVMLSDVLAFDLRVFDPGAPLFATLKVPGDLTQGYDVVLSPSDIGWRLAYDTAMPNFDSVIDGAKTYPFVGQGAYVDLGYGYQRLIPKNFFTSGSFAAPWFFAPQPMLSFIQDSYRHGKPPQTVQDGGSLMDVYRTSLAPGFAVYDTWSFHYENNGINENQYRLQSGNWVVGNTLVDEGTNGLEDIGIYDEFDTKTNDRVQEARLGADDVGERETMPPYDKPLRGVQVIIRAYERDSRAIRQVRVNQHFMPE